LVNNGVGEKALMARKISLRQFSAILAAAPLRLEENITIALVKSGPLVVEVAKNKIGNYQGEIGHFPAWEPLAADTVAEKTAAGYAPPDNPLLRTGGARSSITSYVARHILHIGSDDKVLLWQTLGTRRGIPPRPVIGPALYETWPLIRANLWRGVRAALGR
jgi:hypothetical protein